MGPFTKILLTSVTFAIYACYAQTPSFSGHCAVSAVPFQVRAEGLAERTGDILLQCSGANPGAVLSGNLTLFYPVAVSNRINPGNTTLDAVLSVDYGSGFTPAGIPGLVMAQSISFNGMSFTVPASGALNLKVSNVRVAANQLGMLAPRPITVNISSPVPIDLAQLVVAYPQTGLFATLYDKGIACVGSALPDSIGLANLFAAQTAFASTRVTEGFGTAFQTRGPGDDTGTRFLVNYSGFPAAAQLFIPDMVAGSDALVPTAGGDLGLPQAVGQYVPGSGTLLLVRVQGADSAGAGGNLVQTSFDSASAVPLTNGSGYAVYEVVDANSSVVESAQFPTFIGLPKATAPAVAQETISLAPTSTLTAASATAPVPRFAAVKPASDCGVVGDCQAPYFPKLAVPFGPPVLLTAFAGGAMSSAPGYIPVQNIGGGIMNWTATVSYVNGSGWLTLDNPSGQNNGSVRAFVNSLNLAVGTYKANVVIDAGPLAGSVTVPVTLTAQGPTVSLPVPTPAPPSTPTPAPVTPRVTVNSVVSAATFAPAPIVAGSLSTVMGANLAGKNVAVTFDGSPASLLYTGATQINLLVPDLGAKTSTSLVVTVDGVSSAPKTLPAAPAWPAIFPGGVLNQDGGVNGPGGPAKAGSVLQIFATGIPDNAVVSVQIGDQSNLLPLYAGGAPGIPGLQQVNVRVPVGMTAGTAALAICATAGGQSYCSTGFPLNVQ